MPSPPTPKELLSVKRYQKNLTMPEPKAFIELDKKPLNPVIETLNDRRLRSVARWHAFAMREEARVWNEETEMARQRPIERQEAFTVQGEETVNTKLSDDLRENEPDTKEGSIEDSKQVLSSSDKTVTIEKHNHDPMNGDEARPSGTAKSDSSAIEDDERPEEKQAVIERAEDHHEPVYTLDFNRVYAKKAEMPVLEHSAAAISHEDRSVNAPHTPAPEAKAEKTGGDVNHLDEESMKERSMMWE
ncbi:hypothetical protein LTR12_000688 [Friedmanniomyces endolithicus]|nr:hypothetical protein LTR12_000688 [Friedmanniomyces endolithicus]